MTLSADIHPITTGLLAYGMSGKLFHAPFLAQHPGFALRSVVERSQPRMALDYPGIVSYPSTEALLADQAVELVVVNTPNDTHYELARAALLAGKHVLVEKPVATTAAEVRALYALGRQVGRQVLAYQNRRWDTDFSAVRRVVESGQLGALSEAHFRFDRYRPALSSKVFKEEAARAGSGLHYDLGAHLLDQAISLWGKPLHATRTLATHRPGSQVPDFFSFHLRYPNDFHVWLTGNMLVIDPDAAYVLNGSQGGYFRDRTDPQEAQLLAGMKPLAAAYGQEEPYQRGYLTLVGADGQPTAIADPAVPASYMALFDAVYQVIRHGQPYPITEDEVAWQLEIIAGETL